MTVRNSLRLKELRRAQGISQAKLGAALGLRQGTISSYETGATAPDARMLMRMAEFLSVSVSELIAQSDDAQAVKPTDPDADLDAMDRDALLAAARAMRHAIRAHRDASGHDLCWRQPEMWALLPDAPRGGQEVPDWPQFLRGCVRYRQSLDAQLPDAPRTAAEFDG